MFVVVFLSFLFLFSEMLFVNKQKQKLNVFITNTQESKHYNANNSIREGLFSCTVHINKIKMNHKRSKREGGLL